MAKKINLFIIFIISIIFISHIYASETEDLIKTAVNMINQKSYEKAITVLKKASGKSKSNSIVFFLMGDAYQYQKKYDEAIVNYKKSIEIIPGFGDAYYNTACAYYSTGNTKSAIKWLDRAKNIFYKQEQYKKYENILEKLISLTSEDEKENYKKEMERFIYSSHGSFIPTPTPGLSSPTVLPNFPLIAGKEIGGETPCAMTIKETPYNETIIYNYDTKKLYVPAEDFIKKIGLKGYYDFTKGTFMVNHIVLPAEYITMDKYENLYISVIDVINFLKISYMYNEYLNRPVLIIKPDGLNYEPGKYPTTAAYPAEGTHNSYKNYDLTPYPTPNW